MGYVLFKSFNIRDLTNGAEAALASAAWDAARTSSTNPGATKGQEIVEALNKLDLMPPIIRKFLTAASRPTPCALLTQVDRDKLLAGNFDTFDISQLSRDQQSQREHINRCVDHFYQSNAEIAVRIFLDPSRMREVESIMEAETTANWLLNLTKKNKVPALFHEYKISKATHYAKMRPLGIFHPVINYISLFVNSLSTFDLASVFAHEARHFFQELLIPSRSRRRDSPVDTLILTMTIEGDSHAIESKVNWGLRNKFGQGCLTIDENTSFANNFANPAYAHLTFPGKVRKATQDAFILFLESQLSDPTYLAEAVHNVVGDRAFLTQHIDIHEQIKNSRFLTTDFLSRLSTVAPETSYLDAEGMTRLKQIFTDKIADAFTSTAPTKKRSPPHTHRTHHK